MNEPAAGLTPDNDRFPLHTRGSQSSSRKSRSISRYFLGSKRSSVDASTPDVDISRCLTSAGVFDRCERWTSATLFRGFRTCQRLLIITDSNQLIVGKSNPKQSLFKIKHRIDLHRVWLHTNFTDYIPAEITSLTYYDRQRALIIGWPLADNFLVEFDSREVRESWHKRMQSALNSWWQLNSTSSERVRVVIDQHQDSDPNNNSASFLIRKVISIRPQDTVRDLIKKCIDTSHLQNSSVDDYVLYVLNDAAPAINPPLQANPTQLIPLIVWHSVRINIERQPFAFESVSEMLNDATRRSEGPPTNLFSFFRPTALRSKSLENVSERTEQTKGHEYPYAIKMKHLKASNNISFDADDHSSLHSHHNSSTTSLNNISAHSHDFELRKRDAEHSSKKHRFFHKRKTKENCAKPPMPHAHDDYQSSSTATPVRRKPTYEFFGQTLDELMKQANNQLPGVLQQLLEVLYFKGPETTGIFRKVANTRSVKESIEKIERRLPLKNDDLHPILAAGIFKHFLRNLPDPVFNAIQYDHWKKCLRLPTLQEKVTFARRSIIGTLSEANHLLLKGFICVLSRISQNADSNGMNPFNLGLCVSNSLFKTESTTITSGKQEADVMSSIVEFMILNCSSLFGSDVLMCIPDKRIVVHQIPSLTRPAASSIESLDEVESSPHLPVVNRSRDSGLATSDQPFNDDSSEISEHFRRLTPATPPDWTSSIACGNGTVITSIILPTAALSITRCRNLKSAYKPSKRFMERDRQVNDTTDDSEHDAFNGDSSVRSSTTTVHNMAVGKIKRSKPISRHSSLGSNEHHHQQQQQQLQQQPPALTREPKRPTNNDVKRASSLKQFHHLSDEGDDDDEQNKALYVSNNVKKKVSTIIKKHEQNSPSTTAAVVSKVVTQERRSRLAKSKNRTSDDESMTTRSTPYEQHDLDLTSEPLSSINQRLTNSSALRSASFTLNTGNKHADAPTTAQSLHPPVSMNFLPRYRPSPATLTDDRLRSTGPLLATTNQIYITTRDDDGRRTKAERDRTFIHHADSRPFKLGTAIQMKPVDEQLLSSANGRCRPCHRQNALRYKTSEQDTQTDRSARTSAPMALSQNRIYSSEHTSANIPRYQSIERRTSTPAQQAAIKAVAFESNAELRPCDISWSVREKAKIFEHATPTKLSTGRENYV